MREQMRELVVCARVQGVLSITWLRLAKQVQMRNYSLTYGSATAGDVHHIVDNRACSPFSLSPTPLSFPPTYPPVAYVSGCAPRSETLFMYRQWTDTTFGATSGVKAPFPVFELHSRRRALQHSCAMRSSSG
jgi:hypothetical protein